MPKTKNRNVLRSQLGLEQYAAEQATGCRESAKAGGPFWQEPGTQISDAKAKKLFAKGERLHAPNAGAGSYQAVMKRLGMQECEAFETGSSAGDWTLRVYDGTQWYMVAQTNRHPYHGFSYCLILESAHQELTDGS